MPDDLRDQFPKVREVVKALGIPVYEMEGYEADDAIGTLVGQAEAARSRGRDPHRRPGHAPAGHGQDAADVRLRGGMANTVIYDRARDRGAVRPATRSDDRLQGAQGRPDRQHPGVPGVGEKTAAKLIREHEDVGRL